MDIAIFTPFRPADEFNDIPEPNKRKGSVFWSLMTPLLNRKRCRRPTSTAAQAGFA